MTKVARRKCVSSFKLEIGLLMIESCGIPSLQVMTIKAIKAELGGIMVRFLNSLIIGLMTCYTLG